MRESIPQRYGRWGVGDLLAKYPGLRIVPSVDENLTIAGRLAFAVRGPQGVTLSDAYDVRLMIPPDFPDGFPFAWETGGRIPPDFHKLEYDALCLGAPTEQWLVIALTPTLLGFVEKLVIPYLFSYSYFAQYGVMPFGELEHGITGLRKHFASLFDVSDDGVNDMVRLASLRKRSANKYPYPCRSGRRLGRCHHRRVNFLRAKLKRAWFRGCYRQLTETKRRLPLAKSLTAA